MDSEHLSQTLMPPLTFDLHPQENFYYVLATSTNPKNPHKQLHQQTHCSCLMS
ncbi:hypothetical protein EXN66_Car001130 [Channa argus]|uniref:Uncharacterized protein n=1 Tax=Channa argus TaxID=215402 RepID=A0A6G1QZS2_CHAAH|nr:hypothetical protein EXN66_Car001130 [Channa argus]